jgi:hypothetical protein
VVERELSALQRFVAEAALRPRSLRDDRAMVDRATAAIREGVRLAPVEQLDVYREQFWARHVHSLEDDFSIARHFLGEQIFFDLIAAYVAAYAPSSFDLRGLGAKLPAFAASRAPASDDAMIIESMRLDWAFMEAFDAPPSAPFDPRTISDASEDAWPRATIAFDASLRPLSLAWPLHETRDALRHGKAPERPAARASFVVVYRGREHLHSLEIEPMAFALLEALRGGAELGAACEEIATAHGVADASELGPRVGAWFLQWTSSGWVSEVRI